MKKLVGELLLLLITGPWALTTWLLGVVLWFSGAVEHLQWERPFVLTARWSRWMTARWKYSTTLGRLIVFQPRHVTSQRVAEHERVHVRQVEDLSLLGLALGVILGLATGSAWAFLATWWSAGMWQLPNFLTAILRGLDPYRGSEHELSAYSQTNDIES